MSFRVCSSIVAAAVLTVAGSLASADPVISNITAPDGGGTNIGVKDAGFRMPSGASFELDGVTIRTSLSTLSNDTRVPVFSIWSGATAPAVRLAELRLPPTVQTGWTTLTPSRRVNLLAGETYWIRGEFEVGPGTGGGFFLWEGTADVVPTGVATHVGYLFNGAPSSVENAYRLEGTLSGVCIDFDRTPGADGIIGTSDDAPIVAPTLFVNQAAQLTTDFQSQGVVFLPNPSTNDVNEILNNDTFPTGGLSSEPNLFTTASTAGGVLRAAFLRPVFSVTVDLGLAGVAERLEILDGTGAVIASTAGLRQTVTLSSLRPIAGIRVQRDAGTGTVAIDDLCVSFFRPICEADLSGSSDPFDPNYGVPDGVIDASDFFYFLDRFVEGCF